MSDNGESNGDAPDLTDVERMIAAGAINAFRRMIAADRPGIAGVIDLGEGRKIGVAITVGEAVGEMLERMGASLAEPATPKIEIMR